MTSEQLKIWRTETMRITQRQAAKLLGASLAAYQAWERGYYYGQPGKIEIDQRTALACEQLEQQR